MRSDELIASVRQTVTIEDTHPDWTDAKILRELSNQIATLFSRAIVNSACGYWRKQVIQPVTVSVAKYQVPDRAAAGSIQRVDLAIDSTLDWQPLWEVTDKQAVYYELPIPQTGTVMRMVFRGDQIVLLPVPNNSSYFLRETFYLRPNRIVPQQSSTLGGGTVRGLITAWNPTTRIATVNVIPFDQELAVPAAMTSALQTIDVISPTGWHEVSVFGAPQTFSGLNITIGGTQSVDEVAVGDFVRVSEQTDWPCLPDEWQETLCDAAAVKIMPKLGMVAKAASIAGLLSTDLERFQDLITPRQKDAGGKIIVVPLNIYGGGARRWYPNLAP